MNNLQIFKNEKFGEIRTLTKGDEVWFVGKDVAMALGYSNTKDAISTHVDNDDKQIIQRSENATLENIPNRGLTIINESGLYSLVLSSKLPSAKEFKRWVTSEVLPAIRKYGSYTVRMPDFTSPAEAARAWANEYEARQKALAVIEEQKPKVEYFDDLVDRNTLTNFRDTAKLLHIPQKKFIEWLLENKFIYRDAKNKLQPYARFMVSEKNQNGYFQIKETKSDMCAWSGIQTLITPHGREAFRLLLKQRVA